MPRFAANLSTMYTEHAFSDRFQAAANDGFTAVEYLFPYDHDVKDMAVRLSAHGLQQVLINTPPGDWAAGERGLACIPGKEDAFRVAFDTAVACAGALQCSRLHVMAGLRPGGISDAILRETYVSNLCWAAPIAADAGITLLIEPINLRDMPHYFLNYQQPAHAIVNEVGSPALKVQMDLYHCQIAEGDVSTKLRRYLRADQPTQVGHIQIAGVPHRNEPDSGELDYGELFDLMDSLGYDGWIGCEYRPKGDTTAGLEWLRRLHNAPLSPL